MNCLSFQSVNYLLELKINVILNKTIFVIFKIYLANLFYTITERNKK